MNGLHQSVQSILFMAYFYIQGNQITDTIA